MVCYLILIRDKFNKIVDYISSLKPSDLYRIGFFYIVKRDRLAFDDQQLKGIL